jgi:hypothetical protein
VPAPYQAYQQGGRGNSYYQQQQQPSVTGGTQGQDRNLEARGTNNTPASQNDNYEMNNEKQDQNPRGDLSPAREAVSQRQKTVRETASYNN